MGGFEQGLLGAVDQHRVGPLVSFIWFNLVPTGHSDVRLFQGQKLYPSHGGPKALGKSDFIGLVFDEVLDEPRPNVKGQQTAVQGEDFIFVLYHAPNHANAMGVKLGLPSLEVLGLKVGQGQGVVLIFWRNVSLVEVG